jgi:hypothetical protein
MNVSELVTDKLGKLDIHQADLGLIYTIIKHAYILEFSKENQQLIETLSELKEDFISLRKSKDKGISILHRRQIISSHLNNLSKIKAGNNLNLVEPTLENNYE